MKFLRTPGFLRALRSLLLSGRREKARVARVITVPVPLSRPPASGQVIDLADHSAAARTSATRSPPQTQRNTARLSRQA
jgi:hypothetical protein